MERSRSPEQYRSTSPFRRGLPARSRERYRSRSPSFGRGSPTRSRSISPQRSRSPSSKIIRKKYALYKPQPEYMFPVGIMADIDQNIVMQLDFEGLINLLSVDRSPRLRQIVYQHLQTIINNTKRFENHHESFGYDLLLLREITLLKKLMSMYDIGENLGRLVDVDDEILLNDYLSLLNSKQSKKYIKQFAVDMYEIDSNIDMITTILNSAIEVNNTTIINYVKEWYADEADSTYKKLELLKNQLNL